MINKTKKRRFLILSISLFFSACGLRKMELDFDQMVKTALLFEEFGRILKEDNTVDKTASDQNEVGDTNVGDKMDTTKRHAFTLGNNLIFTADIPENWRYVFHPVYDRTYLQGLSGTELSSMEDKKCIEFIGVGMEDSKDNFFVIIVEEGKGEFEREVSLGTIADEELRSVKSSPFIFRDGTLGVWKYQVWDESFIYDMGDTSTIYYEGIVQADDGKYNIHLFMLKEEYDANETDIINFLESACFSESDAGVDENKGLLERKYLTMHIWDEYLNMSLQIPEGAAIIKNDYYNDISAKVRSYKIYLDKDKHTYFEIISDQGGGIMERTGDSRYYLNTKDFDEAVYELTGYGGGYYFPNWHLWVKHNIGDKNVELLEYVRKIMQSFRFE